MFKITTEKQVFFFQSEPNYSITSKKQFFHIYLGIINQLFMTKKHLHLYWIVYFVDLKTTFNHILKFLVGKLLIYLLVFVLIFVYVN